MFPSYYYFLHEILLKYLRENSHANSQRKLLLSFLLHNFFFAFKCKQHKFYIYTLKGNNENIKREDCLLKIAQFTWKKVKFEREFCIKIYRSLLLLLNDVTKTFLCDDNLLLQQCCKGLLSLKISCKKVLKKY